VPLFLLVASGCLFSTDSDGKKDNDKGTYTLQVDPLLGSAQRTVSIQYFIELQPGDDFAGDVSLSVETAPELRPWFTATTLTIDNPLVELVCYPDSTAVTDSTYTVTVVATHSGKKITHTEQFTLYSIINIPSGAQKEEFDLFVAWLDSAYVPFSQSTDKSWQLCHFSSVGANFYYYSNQSWHITMVVSVQPYATWYFLLRERGIREPCLAVYHRYQGGMTEFPSEGWNDRYDYGETTGDVK
jgi:hypothetical protein